MGAAARYQAVISPTASGGPLVHGICGNNPFFVKSGTASSFRVAVMIKRERSSGVLVKPTIGVRRPQEANDAVSRGNNHSRRQGARRRQKRRFVC
jgi:hypothetical protein